MPARLPARLCLAFALAAASAAAQASDAYSRAESLIRAHQWDQGLAILERLLAANSPDLKSLNLAGLAYTGKGDPSRADQYFESALKLRPDFVPALKNLAINEVTLGETAPARQHLETALKQAPDDPVIHLYLGEIFYRDRDFPHAAEHLERAESFVSRDPNLRSSLAVSELKTAHPQTALAQLADLAPSALNPNAQTTLGVALAQADLPDRALPYLEAAHAAYPAAPGIGYDLALCYLSARRFPDAIAVLQTLPETSDIDNLLAEADEANHQTQPAVDALRRAIALDPQDDDNYLEFASICMDHQAFDDAAKVLAVGLTVHPRSARLLFQRGILNAMQDHFELAEKDFQDAANLSPHDDYATIGLGVTYLEAGDSAQAIPILRKRLKDRPGDANLNYLLGEALLRSSAQTGDTTEAQTYLETAARLDPNLVEPHISLGTIYLQQQKLAEAVTQLETARRLDPKAKSAYSHLALAYRRLGQPDKAKEVLLALKDLNDQERSGSRQARQSEAATTIAPRTH